MTGETVSIIGIIGVALFVIFLVAFIGCAIASSILIGEMVEEINRVALPTERENSFFFTFERMARIKRNYKRLYPISSRTKTLNRLLLIGAALLLAIAVLLFGRPVFWSIAR